VITRSRELHGRGGADPDGDVIGRRPLVLLAAALFLTGTQLATAASGSVPGGLTRLGERKASNREASPRQVDAKVAKAERGKAKPRKAETPPPAPPRTLSLVNQTWVCNGPVDLDSVTVTIDQSSSARDGVHLRDGCTGRIGQLVVNQSVGDGVKVAQGVHDLAIDGGSVRCFAKRPVMHQDGIQVMGGTRITFRNLTVDCGRAGEQLINSNLFIKQAGRSIDPPTDVICVDCVLGGGAAHTVNIQTSVRSGVESSTLCTAKYPKLTLTVGAGAVDPVNAGNTVGSC
jgi:hypothetical protein